MSGCSKDLTSEHRPSYLNASGFTPLLYILPIVHCSVRVTWTYVQQELIFQQIYYALSSFFPLIEKERLFFSVCVVSWRQPASRKKSVGGLSHLLVLFYSGVDGRFLLVAPRNFYPEPPSWIRSGESSPEKALWYCCYSCVSIQIVQVTCCVKAFYLYLCCFKIYGSYGGYATDDKHDLVRGHVSILRRCYSHDAKFDRQWQPDICRWPTTLFFFTVGLCFPFLTLVVRFICSLMVSSS